MQQGVVEGLPTVFGSLNEHLKVLHHLALTAEIGEFEWTELVLKLLFGN